MIDHRGRSSVPSLCCISLLTSLCSCASVEFYKDEALTERTALQYFRAKPHLLVSRTGPDDDASASIQYLPDFDHPTYIKFIPGIGSHNFKTDLSNGMLTSFGQEGDTKIADVLASVAGLVTARAALVSAKEGKDTGLLAEPLASECPATHADLLESTKGVAAD